MCKVETIRIEARKKISIQKAEELFEVRSLDDGGASPRRRVIWHKHAMDVEELNDRHRRRARIFADDLLQARGVKMRIWARDQPEVLERRLELLASEKPAVAYFLSSRLAEQHVIDEDGHGNVGALYKKQ